MNILWASPYRTKLKAIHLLQKPALRIIFNENNMAHSRPLLRSMHASNVYQMNLFQHLSFIYNFNKNETPNLPEIFNNLIEKPIHKYPTNFQKTVLASKRSSSMV